MPQAEPECVAHLIIHASSWTWVCSSFGYSWLLHTQVQLESWITKWATHSGSAWGMNNKMGYTLRFSLSNWTWVRSSFGYSWLKLNLSVYLIWLFMTQAEPECVPHMVIHDSSWTWVCTSLTKWATHSGSAWVMNNQMSYTLRFSLNHE
jgi:hypothetical protein